ncbi:MAG: hypothetical protein U9Q92_01105 [archaeon]|nr:hypothetical protein [archaeon]
MVKKQVPKQLEAIKVFCDYLFAKEKEKHKIGEVIKAIWLIAPQQLEKAEAMTVVVLFDDVKKIDHITKKKVMNTCEDAKQIVFDKYKVSIYPAFYNLSDYWELIRHGSPVTFSEIQEGIPVYDPAGFFVPFKKLITEGKIPGTKEAMKALIGKAPLRLIRIRKQFKMQIVENIYNAVIDACQAPLILAGVSPPAQKEVAEALDNHFAKKGMLEPEYVRYVDEIVKYFKDIEHGEVKNITGEDIDRLMEQGIRIIERAEKLMDEIEREKQ